MFFTAMATKSVEVPSSKRRNRAISLDTLAMCEEHPDMIDLSACVSADQQVELIVALGELGWKSTAGLRSSQLSTGLSNKNYRVSSTDDGPLFLRVYGPTVGDTNMDERHIQECGSFGASIVHRFGWGRLETWLPGRLMTRADCDDKPIMTALAREVRRLHTTTQRNHNDVNLTNIMIVDGSEPVVHIFDFEYAGPLDPPLELANFFLEWTYDNSSEEWWVHDPTCFPTLEQARQFVVLYLGDEATAAAVDDFLALILDGIPKVHLKWSDWATTHFPGRPDYVEFAKRRHALAQLAPAFN